MRLQCGAELFDKFVEFFVAQPEWDLAKADSIGRQIDRCCPEVAGVVGQQCADERCEVAEVIVGIGAEKIVGPQRNRLAHDAVGPLDPAPNLTLIDDLEQSALVELFEMSISSGQATLVGTLVMVDQTAPGPVVLLLSGSGPIDRNSNTKKLAIGVMGQLADHLAGEGLASFRYDKRGVGASGGDYKSTGLYNNVADAAAAIDTLRARADVDPDRIFVIGHSEGALIATELAATDPSLAGVVLLAGTATDGEQVLRWQAEHVSASLPRPVKLLLRVLRQDVVRTQSKRLATIKATTGDTARIQLVKINAKWFREFMAHDPAPSLESIQTPVLALTGSKDIQVNPEDIERICQLVPSDCSGQIIDDLTHLLRKEAGPPSVRTYKKQAKRQVDARLLATASTWIREQVAQTTKETTP